MVRRARCTRVVCGLVRGGRMRIGTAAAATAHTRAHSLSPATGRGRPLLDRASQLIPYLGIRLARARGGQEGWPPPPVAVLPPKVGAWLRGLLLVPAITGLVVGLFTLPGERGRDGGCRHGGDGPTTCRADAQKPSCRRLPASLMAISPHLRAAGREWRGRRSARPTRPGRSAGCASPAAPRGRRPEAGGGCAPRPGSPR
jgi:hypothetical protein